MLARDRIVREIHDQGGWISFARYMEMRYGVPYLYNKLFTTAVLDGGEPIVTPIVDAVPPVVDPIIPVVDPDR